jgi:hypothetical protein
MQLRRNAQGLKRENNPTGSPLAGHINLNLDSLTSNTPANNPSNRLEARETLEGMKAESSTSSPSVGVKGAVLLMDNRLKS